MNLIDDFKKKLLERLGFWRAFLNSWTQKLSQKIAAIRSHPHFKTVLTVVLASLALGFFLGFVATGEKASGNGLSFLQLFPGNKTPFPGTQPDGSFVFSNFENPADVHSWNATAAHMAPSTYYAWEGSWSAKVTFFGAKELASVSIDDLGKGWKRPSDWSKYDSVQFYIFQPGSQTEQLTFMITDLWGKQYQEILTVPRGQWGKYTIPIRKMTETVDIKKINQLSISRRGSGAAIDFYFDDVRLIPSTSDRSSSAAGKMMDYGFPKRKSSWTVFDPQVNGEVVRIPFVVKNETNAFCHLCPSEGGIPLPMGELQNLGTMRIRNAYGEDIPFQGKPLAYWPDRSIKWLAVHFESTLGPGEGAGYFLDYGQRVRTLDFASPLKVTEDGEAIRINTGVLEAVLSKKSFYLFDHLSVDQNGNGIFEPAEEVTSHAQLTLVFHGKEFRTDLDTKTYQIAVEEKGTQKVVVKASGWFQSREGGRYCQAIVRYYFYQGKSYVKVSHTLIYTGYPENKQYAAYKMLRLPDNETIDAYGIRIPYQFSEKKDEQVLLGRSRTEPLGITAGDTLEVLQQDYDLATLKRDGEFLDSDDNYAGWLDAFNESGGIAIAVRHFRENFPKAFRINRRQGELQIDLWPQPSGPLDLATTPKAVGADSYGRGSAFGLAKTHDLMIYFHNGNAAESNAVNLAGAFMEPLMIRTNPYWIDATGALGRLFPVDQKYATEERMLERLFDWAARQPRNFKWYGMLNFGDTLTWWRDQDGDEKGGQKYEEKGWHPVGRWGWYNCEGVGTHTGALLQFVRSGEWKYFEFGENLAKHIMDVDTIHYDTVSARHLKHVIRERYSQVGSMHRHNGDHWGGRTDEASHTNVTGILLYYYLTGNERAFDVAKEVGEYFLKEPFTYIDRPDLAPNRAMSNALWGETLLYQATRDECYKKAADKIIKIFLKGQQPDGSFLENYNAILGTWSGEKHELYMAGYMVGALISYHELTQDEAVKEMFLKLVRYLARREYTGPTILHGLAYAYWITKDPFFIVMAEDNLKSILENQQFSSDSLSDGLIYEKPIYHRPMAFLSTVPYVFEALEEHFKEQANDTRS